MPTAATRMSLAGISMALRRSQRNGLVVNARASAKAATKATAAPIPRIMYVR